MTNVITLIVLSSVVLFMSGCSQLPRDSSTQRTKAYAYRTPQPQYQPQTLPPQTNREPIINYHHIYHNIFKNPSLPKQQ